MKTMTHTSTKTAVAWMIVGGVVALVASMAIGLPWENRSGNPGVINPTVTDTTKTDVITNKQEGWECVDKDGKTIKDTWAVGESGTGINNINFTKEDWDIMTKRAIAKCKELKGNLRYFEVSTNPLTR